MKSMSTVVPVAAVSLGLMIAVAAQGQQGGPNNNAPTVKTGVTSFNGRTGAVVPASGDYGFSLLSGTATKTQLPSTTVFTDQTNSFTANQSINGNLSLTGGNIDLPATTSSTIGVLTLGGHAFAHRFSAGVFPYSDTYLGWDAGNFNSTNTGDFNTGVGTNTLNFNTLGSDNSAFGFKALVSNTEGNDNVAVGLQSLFNNTTGGRNIAIGSFSMFFNKAGSNNIAIGYDAGDTTNIGENGDYNIYIGRSGSDLASESHTIRIGDNANHTKAFIAGISGVTTGGTGAAVVVDSNGQLGIVSSSRRFKYDIKNMDNSTEKLLQLRPVTFRYKQAQNDGAHPLQYGLIAEEVADVYPELVQYDPKSGEPNTVLYHVLPSMLLNAFQKEHRRVEGQAQQIQSLQEQLARVLAQTEQLQSEIAAVRDQQGHRHTFAAVAQH